MKESIQTIQFENPPIIKGVYSVVGSCEGKGPFRDYFDKIIEKSDWGCRSYEKAECKMHKTAVKEAIKAAGLNEEDIQAIISGDLLNQIVSSSYTAREFDSVFLGLYTACSTIAESMIIGSLLLSGKYFLNVVCATSSHFCTAERQYRYPLELGTPRTPLSQWTVTAAGAMVLSGTGEGPRITQATLGKITDYGITDPNDMGAAMAPAAAKTLLAHFKETDKNPGYYDAIISGDLGKFGSELLYELCKQDGLQLGSNYFDCGAEIYGNDEKKKQGGSGAGCSTVIFNSYVYKKLKSREWNRVLFMPTGALMSKDSSLQGESIPCIAQAVCIEN